MRAKKSKDAPSKIIEIQIQIHTRLAILAEEMAVNIASKTNIHPRVDIHRRSGIVPLFCIQKKISTPHLMNAHKANIHIISLPTKFTSFAHISMIHRITTKIPIMNRNDMCCVLGFLIALKIAEIPQKSKIIHNETFIIHQNFHG